jgi:phage tail tape-measure protein
MLAAGVGLASRGVGQIAGSTQIFRTGALGAMGVGAGLGMSWFQATAQLQDVQADLQIATGSAEKAQRAMDFVTKFAVGSRSTVLEVADAFAKLTSFGLDPTIDRMTALNNVATAANVSLSDLVEGAKNVSIGYTRVLERYIARFGYQIFIQRKNEGAFKEGDIMGQLGDQPRFRIGRTTADVISFLSTLGMSDRLKQAAELKVNTLAGALDKLRDSWLLMMYSVNKTGTAERMMAILTALSDMMTGQGGSAFSKSLGEGLNYVFDSVQRGIEFMIKNPDAVKQFLAETREAFKTMVDMINTVGKFMAEHKDFLFFALQNLDKILTVAFIAPVLASVVSAVAGVANVILGLAALKGGVLGAGAAAGAAAAVGGGLSVGAIAAAALAALPVILAAIGLSGAIYGVYRGTKIDEDEDYVMKSGDVPITEGTFKGFHFRPDDPNMRATVRQGFEPIYAPPSMAPGVRSSQSNQQSINIRVGDVKVAAPEGTDPDEFGARVSTSLVDTMQTSLLRFIGEANVRGA